jgi:hypothetical protein
MSQLPRETIAVPYNAGDEPQAEEAQLLRKQKV